MTGGYAFMKKFFSVFLVIALTMFAVSADPSLVNDLSDRALELSFNLTQSSEEPSVDPAWIKRTIGFTDSLQTESFDGDMPVTPITSLPISVKDSEEDSFELIGGGSFYIYWQILSPEKITASISAEALTLEGKETSNPREIINWSTGKWQEQGQTDTSLNESVAINEDDLTLSSADNYVSKNVFVHDGKSKALASYGFVKFDITTDDAASNLAGNYLADVTLTLTVDETT